MAVVPKNYIPLTELGFYVLLALRRERHGYEIVQWTKAFTGGEVTMKSGTVYNALLRMERDGLIRITREDERRKYYKITELGESALKLECMRLKRIYRNSRNLPWKHMRQPSEQDDVE